MGVKRYQKVSKWIICEVAPGSHPGDRDGFPVDGALNTLKSLFIPYGEF